MRRSINLLPYRNLLVAPRYAESRPPEVDEKWRRAIDEMPDKESPEYLEQEGMYLIAQDKDAALLHFKRWIQITTGEEEIQFKSAHKAARAFVWYYIASESKEAAQEISANFGEHSSELDAVTQCALYVFARKRKHEVSDLSSEGRGCHEWKLLSAAKERHLFQPFPDSEGVDPLIQLIAIAQFVQKRFNQEVRLRELKPLIEKGFTLFDKTAWITFTHANFLQLVSHIFLLSLRPEEARSIMERRNSLVRANSHLALEPDETAIETPPSLGQLLRLEELLGYSFCDRSLLLSACTHPSLSCNHNQTLEFVGDGTLGLFLKEFLSNVFNGYPEGPLTDLLHALSDQFACVYYIEALHLEPFLLLGSGEAQNLIGSERRLADFFEALLGALFQDGGYEAVKAFGIRKMAPLFWDLLTIRPRNWKGILNEYAQANQFNLRYEREGRFQINLFLERTLLGTGAGDSWKEAEMQAAKLAVEFLSTSSSFPPIVYDTFLAERVALMAFDPDL